MMKWLEQLQASLAPYPWAYSAIVAGVLILTAFLVNWITKRILLRGLTRILRALPSGESEEGKVRLAIISRLANIVPALVLAYGAVAIPDVHDTLETIIRNVCIAFIVLTTALALGKLLDLVEIAYRRRPDAPNKPIKELTTICTTCRGPCTLIKSICGLTAKIYGTMNAAMASFVALKAVRMGSALAMALPA